MVKTLCNLALEASDNITQEKSLLIVVVILLEQHSTCKNLFQCCPKNSRQDYTRENLVQYCLNTLGAKFHRKSPVQCCPKGSRQHCTGKSPNQCCLNTLGTTFHRKKTIALSSVQHPFSEIFIFDRLIF